MSSADDKELAKILLQPPPPRMGGGTKRNQSPEADTSPSDSKSTFVQWTTNDDKTFVPAQRSCGTLPPGLYESKHSQTIGQFFEKVPLSVENLVKFPESNSQKVISEIEKFWDRESVFRKYGLTFKRGILLWGPPGGGKTCTIKMVISDLIGRNGVILKFNTTSLVSSGLRVLKEIQKDTPVIVLMEDIDAIIEVQNESEVINLLDGVDLVDKIVFLATTNYPEKLGARILNRPSRFDRRFKIGMPNSESRGIYLEKLFSKEAKKPDIKKWVADTEGLSIAHLRELFVATIILQDEYDSALETLRSMGENISSTRDGKKAGF